MFLSDNHLQSITKMATRTAGLRGHAERVAGEAIKTAIVVGATGGMAYVNGRYSEAGKDHLEYAGVPIDLAGGLLISALSFADILGRFDEFGHSLGSGMLGAYAARLGSRYGADAKLAHAAGKGGKVAGAFGEPTLYPTVDAAEHAEAW
jgi:hypothetical protein